MMLSTGIVIGGRFRVTPAANSTVVPSHMHQGCHAVFYGHLESPNETAA